jgi:septal ring factor EnvC (AmiA/AmiB activator)
VNETGSGTPPRDPPPGPLVDVHTRVDGLRSWIGQMERRVTLITYGSAGAALIALAAAIVALLLAMDAQDNAAKQADVEAIRSDTSALKREVARQSKAADDLSSTIGDLERQVKRLADAARAPRRGGGRNRAGAQGGAGQGRIDRLRDQFLGGTTPP